MRGKGYRPAFQADILYVYKPLIVFRRRDTCFLLSALLSFLWRLHTSRWLPAAATPVATHRRYVTKLTGFDSLPRHPLRPALRAPG